MEIKIKPPKNWFSNENKKEIVNIFDLIMTKYSEDEIIFKIIKNNGLIKELSKKECLYLTKILSRQIVSSLKKKCIKDQIKIFAAINASEESVILMFSSLYLGAHHSICFEDLSETAIIQRLKIFEPDIILCRKEILNKLEFLISKGFIEKIPLLVIDLKNDAQTLDDSKNNLVKYYDCKSNLFTLFTSGSTGIPKAVTHSAIRYIDYAKFTTNYFFGIKKGLTIFTATDAAWINGHTYAFYGPLLLGAISIINENPLFISLPAQLGEILDKTKPDCFYTSVTVLRLLKSAVKENENIRNFTNTNFNIDRIGSCGEPLANSVGKWAIKFFNTKRNSIVNTYFQTETGGILVAPRDEDFPPKDYSSVGKPREGLGLVIAKEIMNKIEIENEGLEPNEILICNSWDGIFKDIVSNKKDTYFTKSGFYRLHDIGYRDKEGYLYIGGRSDDVINVAGHRISSSEIESITIEIDGVNEACAVEIEDTYYGSKVMLYFSTSFEDQILINKTISKIKNIIQEKLTQYHLPKKIFHFKNLPKTKSGKLIRRLMRLISEESFNQNSFDYSTLANKQMFLESFFEFNNLK